MGLFSPLSKWDVAEMFENCPPVFSPVAIIDDMLAGVGWSMKEYLGMSNSTTPYLPPLPNGHRLFVHDLRGVAVRSAVAMGKEGDAVVLYSPFPPFIVPSSRSFQGRGSHLVCVVLTGDCWEGP